MWLTVFHGMFIINELVCRPYLRSLFHIHILIDSVILSGAALFLVKLLLPKAITRERAGKGFWIYALSLAMIMIVSTISIFSDTDSSMRYTLLFLMIGIFVVNAVFTFTCLNVLFLPYLQVSLFWLLSHAS